MLVVLRSKTVFSSSVRPGQVRTAGKPKLNSVTSISESNTQYPPIDSLSSGAAVFSEAAALP